MSRLAVRSNSLADLTPALSQPFPFLGWVPGAASPVCRGLGRARATGFTWFLPRSFDWSAVWTLALLGRLCFRGLCCRYGFREHTALGPRVFAPWAACSSPLSGSSTDCEDSKRLGGERASFAHLAAPRPLKKPAKSKGQKRPVRRLGWQCCPARRPGLWRRRRRAPRWTRTSFLTTRPRGRCQGKGSQWCAALRAGLPSR